MTVSLRNPTLEALRSEWTSQLAQTKQKLSALDQRIQALYDEVKGVDDDADIGTGDGGIRFFGYDFATGTVISVEAPAEFIAELRPSVEQAKQEGFAAAQKKVQEAEEKAKAEGKAFTKKDGQKIIDETVKKAVEALPVFYSEDRKKIQISRDPKNAAFLATNVEKFMRKGSLATSSWARNTGAADSPDSLTVAELKALSERNPNIKFKVLAQAEEAEVSALSLANLLLRKNPNNKLLAAVTPQNTIQFEAGKGSTQSFAVLQTQTAERAGAWVDKELKAGKKNPTEIKDELKASYLKDLAGVEAIQGKKNVVMQGLLAVCLSNDKIVKSLGLDKNDWIRAQIPVELPAVIAAVQANLDGAPSIATLALLEAFQEKYGSDFSILNMKEEMDLYNADGSKMGASGKICGSHGAAVKHFTNLRNELDAAQMLRTQVQERYDYDAGLINMLSTI